MKIYTISGLGADWRVFESLDAAPHLMEHIAWQEVSEQESIQDYASRLSKQIDTSQPFVLLGMSFGGMVAVEMEEILDRRPEMVILISSCSNKNDLYGWMRLAGALGLHRILPSALLLTPSPMTYWLFGTKNGESKQLLNRILKDTSPKFLKWALNAIVQWKYTAPFSGVMIHGKDDRILPFKKDKVIYPLKGGHFVIVDRAAEVSEIIRQVLKSV